ncbi:transposase [Streptomyces solaniscabiei]|uniref:transposase n=1 Tax=Streptomyces solaniscabiei TaxID=2683255 RepID=UPI001CE3A49F
MPLSDAQSARIEPLLPDRTPRRGGRWRDHHEVIDAIAFKYRTSTPWMDLPERFASAQLPSPCTRSAGTGHSALPPPPLIPGRTVQLALPVPPGSNTRRAPSDKPRLNAV